MVGWLDDFFNIGKNFNDETVWLRLVFGRFGIFENRLFEIGKLDDKGCVRFYKDFIIDLIDAFDDLEVFLDSLIERQYHDWGLLVAFDASNEALNFVHGSKSSGYFR